MKTAALDTSFNPDLLVSLGLQGRGAAAPSRTVVAAAEAQPVCWRSEAFAEDLSDLFPATAALSAASTAAPRRPLLRRALAAVLRR